ncbi:MAG: AEC family transporter [Candidatus Wallbacteria bacterium]|nr:AEC family transporter [Candidatus Wallbacteria bacterium]
MNPPTSTAFLPLLLGAAKILAPVVAMLALGYAVGAGKLSRSGRAPELGWMSWLALYVLSPCQVFSGLYHAPVALREAATLFGVISAFLMVTGAIALGTARAARLPQSLTYPFLLTVVFGNSGFYGIPVCYLAFGKEGFTRAVLYMCCTAILSNTVGLYLAARGKASSREAIATTVRSPILWGLILSLVARGAGVTEPKWGFDAVDFLSTAAIPLVLVLLGAQLAQLELERNLKPLCLSAGLRLIVAPLVASQFVALAGFEGVNRAVVLVEAGMPTAIVVGLFAVHFGSEPRFAAAAVLLSTMLSPLTLLVLLALVGR